MIGEIPNRDEEKPQGYTPEEPINAQPDYSEVNSIDVSAGVPAVEVAKPKKEKPEFKDFNEVREYYDDKVQKLNSVLQEAERDPRLLLQAFEGIKKTIEDRVEVLEKEKQEELNIIRDKKEAILKSGVPLYGKAEKKQMDDEKKAVDEYSNKIEGI